MAFSGHRARKRFGQHWLWDAAVLRAIADAAELGDDDLVLEIGPGRGALTERLLAAPVAGVRAIELDRDLLAGLRHRFGDQARLTLIEGDVLRVPLTPDGAMPATKVVANIPYNTTAPLLGRLLGTIQRPRRPPFRKLVLLLQKEVAQRLHAGEGSSSFSALSVRIQLLMRCMPVCDVPPRCFQPPPKVQSQVVVLEPRSEESALDPAVAATTDRLLRCAFAARRKMLRNTLGALLTPELLADAAREAAVDPGQRPQEIAPAQWVSLARAVHNSGKLERRHSDG